MVQCLRERFLVADDFLPEPLCNKLRQEIDDHLSNSHLHANAHQIWNYWHVPGLYTYLRTMPEKIIAYDEVTQFVEYLSSWAATNLGLSDVCWPWLSLYIPGCTQGLHNDSGNGRLGYVYSLTRNERATTGGDTLIMHERDLFRDNLTRAAAGTALYDLIAPQFNRLTLFDDRIPHAVQRVDGSMDPVEGRIVLHGHIKEGGTVADGALASNLIDERLEPLLEALRAGAPTTRGPVVYRLEISCEGDVSSVDPIFDRLVSTDSCNLDAVRHAAVTALKGIRFPRTSGSTRANIPLVF